MSFKCGVKSINFFNLIGCFCCKCYVVFEYRCYIIIDEYYLKNKMGIMYV